MGFSGVLFALKVLVNHFHADSHSATTNTFGFDIPRKAAIWTELIIIQLLVPKASFLGHLAGILAGLVYLHGFYPIKLVYRYVCTIPAPNRTH